MNMWFTKSEAPYVAGQPNFLNLNFFLTEEEESRTIRIHPPITSSEERILKAQTVEFPESFVLTPTDPRKVFEIPLDLISGGLAQVEVMATSVKPDGKAVPFSADRNVRVEEGLTVTLTEVGREESGPLALEEETTVRLVVKDPNTLEGSLTNVVFEDPAGLEIPEQFEITNAPESTAIGKLGPGEEAALEWTVKAKKPGNYTFRNAVVSATDPSGDTVRSNVAELTGKVSAFNVTIIYPEDPLKLERKENDGNLNDPAGYQPLVFNVIVRVAVPKGAEPIEKVSLQGFDASDGGLDIDLVKATGIPDAPWEDVIPQPAPLPVYVSQRANEGTKPGVIEPGQEVEFLLQVTAERPGNYDMAALVTASPLGGGAILTERGNSVTKIHGDLVLSIQLEVVNKPARITEGEAVEITGLVENLTLDETIVLDPLLVFSSGQGVPLGPVALDDALPPAGVPGIFNPLLEPGQSERFRLRVQTVALPGFDQREMGRHSVIIDFGASGTVIDPENKARDLGEDAIIVEWGNGSHQVQGATFLRAQVDADLRPTRLLSPEQFYLIAAGEALEKLATGGGEAIAAIPGLLASLPSTLWSVANFAGQVHVEKVMASRNAARYLWAWMDLQIDIWAGLDTSQREQNLRILTEELILYYGPHFESADQMRQIINKSITDYFVTVEDYQKRAYDASGYGFNQELAEIVGEPFRPAGKFLVEEALSAAAVFAWTSRAPRSPEVLEQLSESRKASAKKSRKLADEGAGEMASLGDPRITEYPDAMKALPASTPLTARHAREGYAIDAVSDRNLIKMTDVKNGGMPIFAAIRSRADETIEWMKTRLGIVPKPMTFKPKNVNADDVRFLGYRDGVGYGDVNGVGAGDRGATILAEPLDQAEVLRRLEDAGVDDTTFNRVLERHNERLEEWYGRPCCDRVMNEAESKFWELSHKLKFDVSDGKKIGKGTLEVPRRGYVPQPSINWDLDAPTVLDARQFELRQVATPPDSHLFPDGRQYYEFWLEDDLLVRSPTDPEVILKRGAMRRIAGDIDVVAVGMADGSALPTATAAGREFSRNVGKNFLCGIQGQHPWSSSLTIPKLFEKFVNNRTHRWHDDIAKRGEPLIIYVNGERRVGWFHPTRAIDAENPLKHFMWLDGGTGDIDEIIRFQKDLRGSLDNPRKVNPPTVKPTTSILRQALLSSDITEGSNLIASCTIQTSRTSGTLYRLSRNTIFQKRKQDGTWEEADPTEGCGEDSGIVVWPETFMSDGVVSGTIRIPITEDLLYFDWRSMFRVGDNVVIAPGTPQEETRRISGQGSLILDRSLTFSHDMGTQIISLGTTADDLDADGLSDERERQLGTHFFLPDTDGDGVDDGTEVRLGTDPLVADQAPGTSGIPLSITSLANGQLELRWIPLPNRALEQSLSMQPGTWTPLQEQESGVVTINPFLGFGYFRLRDE